ncbi:MAG: rRNA maturation RNase YbeY [Bacteroidota bacterium]|jgi:probable rRNA maturation factor
MPIAFKNFPIKTFKGKRAKLKNWLSDIPELEKRTCGKIAFIFCSDDELLKINTEFLNHRTLTDIITFDYSKNLKVEGEIYISVDRVIDNAERYQVSTENELMRVMAHGILHLCGYKDKNEKEVKLMRSKENKHLSLAKKTGIYY